MKKTINKNKFFFLPVASNIQTKSSNKIIKKYSSFFSKINGEKCKEKQLSTSTPIAFFILTGGTENKVLKLLEKYEKIEKSNTLLIAHPNNNSLPAALEILAKIQQEQRKGKIVYISHPADKESGDKIQNFIHNQKVLNNLRISKIGLIGDPSDWLVASTPEYKILENNWGPSVVKISLKKVYKLIHSIPDKTADLELQNQVSLPRKIIKKRKNEFLKAIKIYLALKNIVEQEDLDTLTLRCFDLIVEKKSAGCLALALLNKEGIIAGCEADLVSTLGMLWSYYLLDKKSWMANPSRINLKTNSILLAHCTVSVDLVNDLYFPTHFESGLSIGIKGKFTRDDVTLLRIGGKNLDKLWLAEGTIIENTNHKNLCRTQVKVKLNKGNKTEELLKNPLGNHIVLIRGKHKSDFINSWNFLQTK